MALGQCGEDFIQYAEWGLLRELNPEGRQEYNKHKLYGFPIDGFCRKVMKTNKIILVWFNPSLLKAL